MAANRDDSNQPRKDEDNPFVAFRRYADEQISSFFQGLLGLPSTSTAPPRRWHSDVDTGDEGETSRHKRCAWRSETDCHSRWHCSRSHRSDNITHSTDDGEAVDIPVKKYVGNDTRPESQAGSKNYDHRDTADNYPDWRDDFITGRLNSFLFGPFDDRKDHDDEDDFFSPFFSSPFSRHAFHPSPNLFLAESMLFPKPSLITYVMFSPYSPLYVEQAHKLRGHRDQWRNAFEDLIFAEQGKAMPEKHESSDGRDEAKWVLGLLERGAFGDWKRLEDASRQRELPAPSSSLIKPNDDADKAQKSVPESPNPSERVQKRTETKETQDHQDDFWPVSFFGFARPTPGELHEDHEDDTETVTEEDLYNDFFGLSNSEIGNTNTNNVKGDPGSTSTSTSHETQHSSNTNATTTTAPNVLSTMTTTERTTLPDGRVQTRVVLKKRFADGREESSETVHTAQGSSETAFPRMSESENPENPEKSTILSSVTDASREAVQSGKKKSGWFWSN
ncbi:hypothetical protein L228DRAFT_250034 [Xylona heveae TC161]|uniref:Uncharacterized protein n=1 Tax=Xylona heveae (strain CBS 132557 / TC161) TaxID=1328760 RepID=A0A165AEP2_XYLHT|nr:hypothetical protein L228DRAFT_250034 [Xylona heveae TC161]KZF20353.1 hypothetical protein L228DRAFT_250034 [Xylona heveae TC161]